MIKKETLMKKITDETGIDTTSVRMVFDMAFDILAQELREGNDICIRGFGSFNIKERRGRKGRNFQTNQAIIVPPHFVVKFIPSLKINLKNKK